MVRLKSKLLELYRNYNLANFLRRVARFWKDRSWQSSSAAAKEVGLKIQNTAQPKGQSGLHTLSLFNTKKPVRVINSGDARVLLMSVVWMKRTKLVL